MAEEYADIEEKRIARFKEVISKRQADLTVVLENVHDPHNIGAVLRSCDAVGISEVYILYTEADLIERGISIGKTASTGVKKWITIHTYHDVQSCFTDLQMKYSQIMATHLSKDAISLYNVDLTLPTALVFGNEHEGISQEALSYCTGNVIIPQMGMVQSLNISVACAVSIFEASRQRQKKEMYSKVYDKQNDFQATLLSQYVESHRTKKGYTTSAIKK